MTSLENAIPPPLVALLCACLMWVAAQAGAAFDLLGPLRELIIAGLLALATYCGLSAAFLFRDSATTLDPRKPSDVSVFVTDGVFRRSRNPMYLGMAFILTAWAFYLASLFAFAGVVLFVVYINRFQIVPEERALQARFGDDFRDYCKRVRRWL
ncbi:MAG: isoprenylcysteine carboxylmethyltransferase family protein [Pseudomonadota bacterium]